MPLKFRLLFLPWCWWTAFALFIAAVCVSSFPFDLDHDQDGTWTGRVAPRVIVGSVIMTILLVVRTVALLALFYSGRPGSRPPSH